MALSTLCDGLVRFPVLSLLMPKVISHEIDNSCHNSEERAPLVTIKFALRVSLLHPAFDL